MSPSIICGDPTRTRTEYAVALPSGKIVTDSGAIDARDDYRSRSVGSTHDKEAARKLADLYNAHYEKVGAATDARPVERIVTTSYSDWAVIEVKP